MECGIFITFEGMDGSGKTTQIEILKTVLEKMGYNCIFTRELGGTLLGEELRKIILSKDFGNMLPETEAMLYAACRAQHVEEVIRPALKQGKVVLCDRYIDSSVAYQKYGRKLGSMVEKINEAGLQQGLVDGAALHGRDLGAFPFEQGRDAAQIDPAQISGYGDQFAVFHIRHGRGHAKDGRNAEFTRHIGQMSGKAATLGNDRRCAGHKRRPGRQGLGHDQYRPFRKLQDIRFLGHLEDPARGSAGTDIDALVEEQGMVETAQIAAAHRISGSYLTYIRFHWLGDQADKSGRILRFACTSRRPLDSSPASAGKNRAGYSGGVI